MSHRGLLAWSIDTSAYDACHEMHACHDTCYHHTLTHPPRSHVLIMYLQHTSAHTNSRVILKLASSSASRAAQVPNYMVQHRQAPSMSPRHALSVIPQWSLALYASWCLILELCYVVLMAQLCLFQHCSLENIDDSAGQRYLSNTTKTTMNLTDPSKRGKD